MSSDFCQPRPRIQPLANQRGRLMEIPLLLALLLVSIAIGAGQLPKYGWPGFFIGAAIVFFGVIAGFAALIGIVSGIFKLNELLRTHSWYVVGRSLVKWLLLLAFFFFWSVVATMGLGGLFEVDVTAKQSEWMVNLFALAAGVVLTILCYRLGPGFWPKFWRFSGLLLLGGMAVFVSMMVGPAVFANPDHLTLALKIVFFLPLVVYGTAKRFKKAALPPVDER